MSGLSLLTVVSRPHKGQTGDWQGDFLPAFTRRTRILLVDDHSAALRQFVRMLDEEFEVVGTAPDGLAGVRAAAELQPDVVTLDMTMPDIDGLEVARRIRKSGSAARIVFLTIHADSDYVEAALRAGAVGYVLKSRAAQDLVTAIRSSLRGEVFVSPGAELDSC
jgi:DNA-binding NarL/FixJ family response regulator